MNEERLRLFVALELPERARRALAEWRDGVLDTEPGLRPVAADALHVTLCFLGWRWQRELGAIAGALEVVASEPLAELSVSAAGWLPARRPRVLAVELADAGDGLPNVQAILSNTLQRGGWYVPEARPFLAHVTVARVPKGVRVRRHELPDPPALRLSGSTVTLFRSLLRRGGAEYEPLHSVELSR